MEGDGSSSHPDKSKIDSKNSSSASSGDNVDNPQILCIPTIVSLMRQTFPHDINISDEAKKLIWNHMIEFIEFIADEANERCKKENRRVITSEDLITTMANNGFDFTEPLTMYLKQIQNKNNNNDDAGNAERVVVGAPNGPGPGPMGRDGSVGDNKLGRGDEAGGQ